MPSRRDVLRSTAGSVALAGGGTVGATTGGGTSDGDGEREHGRNRGGPPAGKPYPDEVDPRYLVGVSSLDAARMVTGVAREVHFVYDWGTRVGATVLGRFDERTRSALEKRPRVRYVETDRYIRPAAQSLTWNVDRVDAEQAHGGDSPFDGDGSPETGSGADVAILDTGIDSDHPDLTVASGTSRFSDFDGNQLKCDCGGNTCNQDWDDDQGHGTHVAGVVGANDDSGGVVGVAPGASLHAAKIMEGVGCADPGQCKQDCNSVAILAAALKWAADGGHDVANLALTGPTTTSVERDALSYAYFGYSAARGTGTGGGPGGITLLPVSAVGNPGTCTSPGGAVEYPARYNFAVGVSAVGRDGTIADYSATGSDVELAAPGGSDCDGTDSTSIRSTALGGGTGYATGTSQAAAHVSGTAALLIGNGMDPFMAREQMAKSAEDVGLPSSEQGYGLVDAANALALDSSDSGSNSLGPTVVRGQQDRIDATTARLHGWWSGVAAADVDEVGFRWREFDPNAGFGSWQSWTTTAVQTTPPMFSHDITMKAQGTDGCFAYQYEALLRTANGDASSWPWAFWNATCCTGC